MKVIHYDVGHNPSYIIQNILKKHSPKKPLVLTQNKDEAEYLSALLLKVMPQYKIEFKTIAKLTYDASPKWMQDKLQSKPSISYIKRRLGLSSWAELRDVMNALGRFVNSGKTDFWISKPSMGGYGNGRTAKSTLNVDFFDLSPYKQISELNQEYINFIVSKAQYLWKLKTTEDVMPIGFDELAKYYQITSTSSIGNDLIVATHAEDLSPPKLAILMQQQKTNVFLLADVQQAIFNHEDMSLLEAYDSEDQYIPGIEINELGPNIGSFMSSLKNKLTKNESLAFGVEQDRLVVSDKFIQVKHTIITRSQSAALLKALAIANAGIKVHLFGGMSAYGVDDILDIFYLKNSFFDKIKNKFLTNDFENYEKYKSVAESVGDLDMIRMCSMIEKMPNIEENISKLKEYSTSESNALVVVSTVHKAKGKSWSVVSLGDDFISAGVSSIPAGASAIKLPPDVLRCVYAASGCAVNVLKLSSKLHLALSS